MKTTTKKNPEMKPAFSEDDTMEMTFRKEPEVIEPDTHWTEEEPRNTPDELDTSETLVHLYLSATRRTPMLPGQEENRLGSYIEQEKYLTQIEQELAARYDREPSASDVFIALLDNFCRESSLFEALCQQFQVPDEETIAHKATYPKLLQAIDGYIDPQLVNDLSKITGSNNDQTLRAADPVIPDIQLTCGRFLKRPGHNAPYPILST